jgi:hypothetical protein
MGIEFGADVLAEFKYKELVPAREDDVKTSYFLYVALPAVVSDIV